MSVIHGPILDSYPWSKFIWQIYIYMFFGGIMMFSPPGSSEVSLMRFNRFMRAKIDIFRGYQWGYGGGLVGGIYDHHDGKMGVSENLAHPKHAFQLGGGESLGVWWGAMLDNSDQYQSSTFWGLDLTCARFCVEPPSVLGLTATPFI